MNYIDDLPAEAKYIIKHSYRTLKIYWSISAYDVGSDAVVLSFNNDLRPHPTSNPGLDTVLVDSAKTSMLLIGLFDE